MKKSKLIEMITREVNHQMLEIKSSRNSAGLYLVFYQNYRAAEGFDGSIQMVQANFYEPPGLERSEEFYDWWKSEFESFTGLDYSTQSDFDNRVYTTPNGVMFIASPFPFGVFAVPKHLKEAITILRNRSSLTPNMFGLLEKIGDTPMSGLIIHYVDGGPGEDEEELGGNL